MKACILGLHSAHRTLYRYCLANKKFRFITCLGFVITVLKIISIVEGTSSNLLIVSGNSSFMAGISDL